MKNKIILGLSGGVDSATAACLLKQNQESLEAVFMKNWDEDDDKDYCPAEQDLADAREVAQNLNIPLHTVNFASEYWDKVFSHFLNEYKAGRTPNPDILCNSEIKFKVFLDYAIDKFTDTNHKQTIKIATGHYARIREQDGQFYLLKGLDKNKDQSYFLHALNQNQLAHALFPLGELNKQEVREIAKSKQLSVFNKKDSTGICFIGERNFNEFLSRFLSTTKGDMVTPEGEVIAQHNGLMYYTIGQRKGLGIGGSKTSTGEPWFVANKDIENNRLIVVQGKDHPLLYQSELIASQIHWINDPIPAYPFSCQAKTRYRQPDQSCEINSINDDGFIKVTFSTAQFGITPGQSIVFYQDDICLGGGIIEK
ncbi:MAG: tRNA 2-thiouridine(34) synthase MnmA [Gammaproteobacteria bacterium]|nr:tRNA 2-thiouridine(34) synthase MnmA [Gammaproteobacteria bacterium]